MLATLVAAVSYMPLKSEILHRPLFKTAPMRHHEIYCIGAYQTIKFVYFSPAPQADPHAAGFGSGFSSPAPQAEPHAPAGFFVSVAAQR